MSSKTGTQISTAEGIVQTPGVSNRRPLNGHAYRHACLPQWSNGSHTWRKWREMGLGALQQGAMSPLLF